MDISFSCITPFVREVFHYILIDYELHHEITNTVSNVVNIYIIYSHNQKREKQHLSANTK